MIKKNILFLFLLSLSFFQPLEVSIADSRVPRPKAEEIIGVWIGYDEDRLYFCRLELEAGAKGFFSLAFPNAPVNLDKINKWVVEDDKLSVDLLPIDAKLGAIWVRGLTGWDELALEMGAMETGWKQRLNLFNEKDFLGKNKKVKSRIDEFKRKAKGKKTK